ncbi:SurA N-terminal domain-containing protein [SAR92 clade bacterium H455]|uniref:Periplasmic chaperone PpiD n=1 Tax=SAR92 clade bacterium H455 TaxID=2974818 RepID=A0ABY5TJ21_9GAMM|nr:SurA N-terminal domain-containing protein [SAR92 clade bacterium H455]
MLDSFRHNMKGIAFGIVILIAIVFAFSGIGSLSMSGSGADTAVTVNGEKVTEFSVLRAISSEKRRILDENEGLDASLLEDELIRPQVVEQIIGRKLLVQSAKSAGMGISSRTTSKLLLGTPAFLSDDGRFDQDLYLYTIRAQGFTSGTFLEMLKDDLLVEQYVRGFVASGFVTASELDLIASITEQQRNYYYLTLPLQPSIDAVQLSDEQIASYYENNRQRYQAPEQVVIDYVELNPEIFSATQNVGEEQVRARYEEQRESLESTTSRQAAHILLAQPNDLVIAEINDRLAAGESFEALAKEYSEDVGSADFGGNLGYTSGDTFPESFESALAALQVGEVSAPVTTDSGTHLIKLVDIQEQIVDFDSERGRIEQELIAELTDIWLVEKLASLKELSYNAENLAEMASELGLTAQVSEPFTRAGAVGISANPAVLKAAFSSEVLEDGYASEVLDLGNDRYVVVKLNKSIPARQKDLAEVQDAVVVSLTDQLARASLAARGTELLARVDSGEDIEAVAKAEGLDWQVVLDAKRSTGGINNEVKRFAFQLPATANKDLIESFYTRSGDFVVVALTDVEAGDSSKLSKAQKASLSYAGVSSNSGRELQAVQQSLRASADIEL